MKTTKIKIRNLFGIKELELNNESIELSGKNGTGKTSVIDAIKYALINNSEREYILKQGESEGEILIETDEGLIINRKKRENMTDYKSIKKDGKAVEKPETFIQNIFTELQLNPVEFIQLSKQEQNRKILDLIEFNWNLKWIEEKFGEIPKKVNYDQNILTVLEEIQAEKGEYYQNRQDLNRQIRNEKSFIEEIAADIPNGFMYEKWKNYKIGDKYKKLQQQKDNNDKIKRAKAYLESYENNKKLEEAKTLQKLNELSIEIDKKCKKYNDFIKEWTNKIEQCEKDIEKTLNEAELKKKILQSENEKNIEKLKGNMGIAKEYSNKKEVDTKELEEEIETAEKMISYINEYERMLKMQEQIEKLKEFSNELTNKIEIARNLPSEILKTAKLPIENLTVKEGIVFINNLPISNLSEGEKLQLCVDIAISKPDKLQIILLDGTEKLSDENRKALYKKCKEKGLQFIATRTTNDNELIINSF